MSKQAETLFHMEQQPKYKIGTTIAVDRQQVLDFFSPYINRPFEATPTETYICREGSLLVLVPGDTPEKVFVQFHLNLYAETLEGKIWFMKFCSKHASEIKNLRSGMIMPVSDGAILSELFRSRAFRITQHYIDNPKDKQVKGKRNH